MAWFKTILRNPKRPRSFGHFLFGSSMNPPSTVYLWPFLVVSTKMILAKRVMSQSPLATTRKGYRRIDQHCGRWVSTQELGYSVVTIFDLLSTVRMMLDSLEKRLLWTQTIFIRYSEKPSFCERPHKKANWFYRIYGELIMILYMYDVVRCMYGVCMVCEGICMVWYMKSTAMVCGRVSPSLWCSHMSRGWICVNF